MKIPHLNLQISRGILLEIGMVDLTFEDTENLVNTPAPDIHSFINKAYRKHIERSGTILFSDIEKIAEIELAIIVDDIIEQRRDEIQNINVWFKLRIKRNEVAWY